MYVYNHIHSLTHLPHSEVFIVQSVTSSNSATRLTCHTEEEEGSQGVCVCVCVCVVCACVVHVQAFSSYTA